MSFITRAKLTLLRFFCSDLSFDDYLACLVGRVALKALRQKQKRAWEISRWIAGKLDLHEQVLLRQLAGLTAYKHVEHIPDLSLEVEGLDLETCESLGCLPYKHSDSFIGLIVCDPGVLSKDLLQELGNERVYLTTVAEMDRSLLALRHVQNEQAAPQIESASSPQELVVVDDNPLFLEAVQNLLESYPIPARVYLKAHDFIRDLQVGRVSPRLVISDINMPEISGFDLAALMLNHGLLGEQILLASSDQSLATEVVVLRMGLAGLIRKSGGPQLFAAHIERLLKGHFQESFRKPELLLSPDISAVA